MKKQTSNKFLKMGIIVLTLVSSLLLGLSIATSSGQTKAFGNPTSDIPQIIERNVDWNAINAASAQSKSKEIKVNISQSQTDNMGNPTGRTSEHNEYTLSPGHTYVQNPSVIVESGSAPCEIFVYVENPITKIEDGTTIADQLIINGWKPIPEKTGLYKYSQVVNAETKANDVQVSNTFTLLPGLTQEDLEKYEDTNFMFTAYAYGTGGKTADSNNTGSLTSQTSDFTMFDLLLFLSVAVLVLLVLILVAKRRSQKSQQ